MTVFLQNNFKDIGRYIHTSATLRVASSYCVFIVTGHVQISQVPGRHEPDENGEINFPFLFQTLVSLGYDQWIGCEYTPKGETVLKTLTRTYAHVTHI